ncbi:alpha-ketoglutarate-dependent dioxygenase alkB-like superfamily [Fadolivirus algeromassiliense]|jgi:hypothetical protein|uniref:Alpha-ketoglutarate-dependent dioxygenase alkB-like superfamily n=1 Tax=Fadolivirus FV1/VV64 TaxID=3070911 RepID=A0A7D3QXX5_9VIRU|nr:alpha-ketoglutarate-dependent dioxygenase alkB-like superfamily [Fadolivirus algeromassiliense]QKF94800.1 alpha-ketoglutarate-dependent dioxygenase alkB-like superfamily [Fadolivirus FV1/VV64]
MTEKENKLYLNKHILYGVKDDMNNVFSQEIHYLRQNFCGKIVTDMKDLNKVKIDTIIYMYGNINTFLNEMENKNNKTIYAIKELSYNFDNYLDSIQLVTLGEVPINIHNIGVFFRNFFNNKNYFDLLNKEHQFQVLTESNKPGSSYRKGIYITNVVDDNDSINFNLLRCSTNLDGPTDNFRETDHEIITKVSNMTKYLFEQPTDLNHVLAQVYNNTTVDGKDKKAKIKDHSDKTKDMPRNGLMAFCTFYKFNDNIKEVKKHKDDPYDYYYKDASVLTRLRFRLKSCVNVPNLVKSFDVVLYPNSVFLMSLTTNRLYTHEIVPSHLPIDKLPIRLGYVIRCSKTYAVFKNNQTYINDNGRLVELIHPNKELMKGLKDTYFKENTSDEIIDYGLVDFSLNNGDYMKPLV